MSPRGSDSQAAGAELQARTGVTPNAEQLIAANQRRWSRELRAAGNRPVDQEATDEMDESDAQGYLEGDETAIDWAVRGPFVVVLAEDEDGNLAKRAFVLKGKEKQAERFTRRERSLAFEAKEEVKETASRASTRRSTPSASASTSA